MEDILKRLREAEEVITLIRKELHNTKDGYFYHAVTYVNNRVNKKEFSNLYVAAETCNHYNGDNGFIELTTNNPEALKLHDDSGCTVILLVNSDEEEFADYGGEDYEGDEYVDYNCSDFEDYDEIDPIVYEEYWRGFNEMCDGLHDDEIYNSITFCTIEKKNKREELQKLEDISHFKHGMGLSILNDANYWFTSDEIEAFREIWLRRISAI